MSKRKKKLRPRAPATVKSGEPASNQGDRLRLVIRLPADEFSPPLDDEDPDDEDPDEDESDEEKTAENISPQMAEVSLAGGWLRIVALVTAVGAVLGPALAAMTWSRWTAGIGAAFLGLAMVIGQVTAAQKHAFRFMRWVDIAFALIAGLVCGAIYGVMAVAFIGAGLGVIAWLLLAWFYRGFNQPALADLPGSRTMAAACGVVVEAFCLNPQAASSGLRYGALIGLGCGALLSLAMVAIVYLVYKNLPRVGYWLITPQAPAGDW